MTNNRKYNGLTVSEKKDGTSAADDMLVEPKESGYLRQGERLDDLQLGGLELIQDPDKFCFGVDAVFLSDFAKVKPGETVLVFGLGTMGLITARILKSWGAGAIAGVDTNGQRLDLVRGLGWLEGVDRGDPRWRERVEELCGQHGADVVIEATGVSQVLQDAFQAVRPGGRIVVGSVYSAPAQEFPLWPIMRKELTIVGAKGPYPQLLTDGSSAVVQTVSRLQEDLRKLITVYPYEKAENAFSDMMSGRAIKAVITF